MTAQEDCRSLCSKIVFYRDRWCQICGSTENPEAHHIWFRSRVIWVVQYDPDYMVLLDKKCHTEEDYAPHVDEAASLDKIMPRIAEVDYNRFQKVAKFLIAPEISYEAKASAATSPDYVAIRGVLRKQLKIYERNYEIDKYNCDPIYRG